MSNIVNIPECEKLYPDEWLLFEVLETDELNNPLKGILLAHSKDRDEIHKIAMENRFVHLYIPYTGEPIPKDMAIAL